MESVIEICVGDHRYDAIVGSGLLDSIGSTIAKALPGKRCAIVTDENVAKVFAERVNESLRRENFEPSIIIVPPGEKSKTLERAGAICEQMLAVGLDRQSLIVALGGGVVGDLAGFVAAIFHRGIRYVQIPTTLLAMVDSSIGGKTGVNTSAGKNLIGAVHHPALVIADVDVLKTLPGREFHQGFAEIIKHAIIADAEMFQQLTQSARFKLDGLKPSSLHAQFAPLIKRNIEIKSSIVAKDERDETGERALLNFGHTVGHAIERAGDYREFLHGEAVSLGMVAACGISMKRAGLPSEQRGAIVDLLNAFGLPTRLPPKFPREKIFEAIPFDKKFQGGKIRFVVTQKIGSAWLSDEVTLEDIREAVDQL
jgi:3-dehydroquinate synthase